MDIVGQKLARLEWLESEIWRIHAELHTILSDTDPRFIRLSGFEEEYCEDAATIREELELDALDYPDVLCSICSGSSGDTGQLYPNGSNVILMDPDDEWDRKPLRVVSYLPASRHRRVAIYICHDGMTQRVFRVGKLSPVERVN